MSRPTPRKPRNRNNNYHNNNNNNNNNSNNHSQNQNHHPSLHNPNGRQLAAASDYESDTAYYMETRETPAIPHPPTRDNGDLNFKVLKRYLPNLRTIVSIASNAVLYNFVETGWEKHGVEGTMFVCDQWPIMTSSGVALPQVSVFVLSRRGIENLVIDLLQVTHLEMNEELLIFRMGGEDADDDTEDKDGSGGIKVLGMWIHNDEGKRDVNVAVIRSAWDEARAALDEAAAATQAAGDTSAAEVTDTDYDEGVAVGGELTSADEDSGGGTPGPVVPGRRLSVSDLFGKRPT